MTNDTKATIIHLYTKLRSTYRVAELTGWSRSTVRNVVTADLRIAMSPVGRPKKAQTQHA